MSIHKHPVYTFILGICIGGLAVVLVMHKLCDIKNTLNETVYSCPK